MVALRTVQVSRSTKVAVSEWSENENTVVKHMGNLDLYVIKPLPGRVGFLWNVRRSGSKEMIYGGYSSTLKEAKRAATMAAKGFLERRSLW